MNREAAKDVKVVLSGEGADELFGGYPLYRQAVWAERWQKMPRAVRRALAALLPGCGLLHRAHCRAGSGPPGPTMSLKQRRSAINI